MPTLWTMLAPAACLVLLAGGTIAQETFAPTRSPTVAPTPALTVPTVSPTVAPTAPTVSPTSAPTTASTMSPTVAPTASTVSPTSAPATGSPTVSPTAVCTSQTLAGNPGANTGARAACPAEFPYLTQHSSHNYTVCYTTAYYATEGNRNPGCQTWCSLSGSTGGMCNRCSDNLPGYTRYSGRDCSGRNELTTTAGVSLQACADSCTAEQSCISFEHSTSHQNGQANVCQRSTSCVNELTTATSNGFSLYVKGNFTSAQSSVGTCVFPFTYGGTTYTGCADAASYGGAGWCAFDSTYAAGRWGYCTEDCPGYSSPTPTGAPTVSPTAPTAAPIATTAPTTGSPTVGPTAPTDSPTDSPTAPTAAPSMAPTTDHRWVRGPVGYQCGSSRDQLLPPVDYGRATNLNACKAACSAAGDCTAISISQPRRYVNGQCFNAGTECVPAGNSDFAIYYFQQTIGPTLPGETFAPSRSSSPTVPPTFAPTSLPTVDSMSGPEANRQCRNTVDPYSGRGPRPAPNGARQPSATTLAACTAVCLGISGCAAISWKDSNHPSFTRCYTAIGPCTSTEMTFEYDVWRVRALIPSPTLPPIAEGQLGICRDSEGDYTQQQNVNSLAACKAACLGIRGCESITWNPSYSGSYNGQTWSNIRVCYTTIGPCFPTNGPAGFRMYVAFSTEGPTLPGETFAPTRSFASITSAPAQAPAPAPVPGPVPAQAPQAGSSTLTTCYFTEQSSSGSCSAASQSFCTIAADAQGRGSTCTTGCFDTSYVGISCASMPASMLHTCQDPGTNDTTLLSGGNDNAATDLEACRGECDDDAQCASGLACFQRDSGEPIPGCHGAGGDRHWDYCYDPTLLSPQLFTTTMCSDNPSQSPSASPSAVAGSPNPAGASSGDSSGLSSGATAGIVLAVVAAVVVVTILVVRNRRSSDAANRELSTWQKKQAPVTNKAFNRQDSSA